MPRVSRKYLDRVAELTNTMLERRGSSARVEVSARMGYHALDLYAADDVDRSRDHLTKTLRIGSTGELETYLRAMQEAIWLLAPPFTDDIQG